MKYLSKKTKQITAGNNLTAEELVEIINDTGNSMNSELFNNRLSELGYTFVNNDGLNTVLNSTASSYISAVALSSTSILIAYSGASGFLNAMVLSINGNTLSITTANTVLNAISSGYISAVALSSTSILIAYSGASGFLNAMVVSNTLSITTANTVLNAVNTIYVSATALSSTSALIAYQNTTTTFLNAMVVSNTLSITTSATALNAIPSSYISAVALSSTSVLIAYSGTSNFLNAMVVSNTLSITTANTVLNAISSSYISAVALSSTSILIAYKNGTTTFLNAMIVSNTLSITTSATTLNSVSSSYITPFALSSNNISIAYRNSTTGFLNIISVNNTLTITNSNAILNSVATGSNYITAVTIPSNSIFIAYDGTSSFLTANVYSNVGGLTALTDQISILPQENYPSVNTASTGNFSSACVLSTTSVFIAFKNASVTNFLHGVVATISGNTVTLGTVTQLTATGNACTYTSCVALSSSAVFVAYQNTTTSSNLYGAVVTISGSTITAQTGAGTQLTTTANIVTNTAITENKAISATLLTSSSVFVAYANGTTSNQLFGVIATITNNAISGVVNGSALTTVPASNIPDSIKANTLTSTSVFVSYQNTSSSNQVYGVVCTISGTTITAGVGTALTTVPASNTSTSISSTTISSTSIFVAYKNTAASNLLYGTICSISGQTITAGVGTLLASNNSIAAATVSSGVYASLLSPTSVVVGYLYTSPANVVVNISNSKIVPGIINNYSNTTSNTYYNGLSLGNNGYFTALTTSGGVVGTVFLPIDSSGYFPNNDLLNNNLTHNAVASITIDKNNILTITKNRGSNNSTVAIYNIIGESTTLVTSSNITDNINLDSAKIKQIDVNNYILTYSSATNSNNLYVSWINTSNSIITVSTPTLFLGQNIAKPDYDIIYYNGTVFIAISDPSNSFNLSYMMLSFSNGLFSIIKTLTSLAVVERKITLSQFSLNRFVVSGINTSNQAVVQYCSTDFLTTASILTTKTFTDNSGVINIASIVRFDKVFTAYRDNTGAFVTILHAVSSDVVTQYDKRTIFTGGVTKNFGISLNYIGEDILVNLTQDLYNTNNVYLFEIKKYFIYSKDSSMVSTSPINRGSISALSIDKIINIYDNLTDNTVNYKIIFNQFVPSYNDYPIAQTKMSILKNASGYVDAL